MSYLFHYNKKRWKGELSPSISLEDSPQPSSPPYKTQPIPETFDDLTLLAKTICGEANSTEEGMLAVGTTIMNRLNCPSFRRKEFGGSSDKPLTMDQACNENAYEARKIQNSGFRNPSKKCFDIARRVMAGERTLPSNMYFFRTASAYKDGTNKIKGPTIGGNTFFTYVGYENG